MKILNTNRREYLLLAILFTLCIAGRAQTVEQVRGEIQRQGIEHPEIVLAQSILETGWFKSYGCTHRKNLFGFYWKGSFKQWDTWEESVKYYADWQRRHFKGGCYYEFLEGVGYASDSKYIEKLKSIKL
jgi:flagellum-specific peptidoglycan hydrolase FlgJ